MLAKAVLLFGTEGYSMSDAPVSELLAHTGAIVATHVANNAVHTSELPKLIASVHEALAKLGQAEEPSPREPAHTPAVSIRKSLASDDHILSMIDGKPYKTLRRHIARHGLSEAEYRTRYNLPHDYPMVAKSYSAKRSAFAKSLGFGRKPGPKVGGGAATTPSVDKEAQQDTSRPTSRKLRAPGKADAKPVKAGRKKASPA